MGEQLSMLIFRRKQIFKALVQAQDEANDYEYKEQIELMGEHGEETDSNRLILKAGYIRISDHAKSIMKTYKASIAERYKLTSSQLAAISLEGLEQNWPLD